MSQSETESETAAVEYLVGVRLREIARAEDFLAAEDIELHVGDRVACGIIHPCTAFDKWPVIPLVNDEYTVKDLYCTYF